MTMARLCPATTSASEILIYSDLYLCKLLSRIVVDGAAAALGLPLGLSVCWEM